MQRISFHRGKMIAIMKHLITKPATNMERPMWNKNITCIEVVITTEDIENVSCMKCNIGEYDMMD